MGKTRPLRSLFYGSWSGYKKDLLRVRVDDKIECKIRFYIFALISVDSQDPTPDFTTSDTDNRLIEMWLHGLSRDTQRGYRRCVSEFLSWVKKTLHAVTLADLQNWQNTLFDYAPDTQRLKMAAIRSLLSFGHKIGMLPTNASIGLRQPKIKDTLNERILSEEEVAAMMEAEKNPRNEAILLLLYTGGLRVAELCALRWKDLSARKSGGQLTIFGKGGKTRIVLLPDPVWKKLCKLNKNAAPSDPVFVSREKDKKGKTLDQSQVNRIVAAAARKARIGKKVSPHWLRHAHATHSLNRGAPLHLVQNTLGHASIATTSRYLHARPDDSSALYLNVETKTTFDATTGAIEPSPSKQQKQPRRTKVQANTSTLKCPSCKSSELQKNGFQVLADGNKHQRFRCKSCGYVFAPLLSVKNKN